MYTNFSVLIRDIGLKHLNRTHNTLKWHGQYPYPVQSGYCISESLWSSKAEGFEDIAVSSLKAPNCLAQSRGRHCQLKAIKKAEWHKPVSTPNSAPISWRGLSNVAKWLLMNLESILSTWHLNTLRKPCKILCRICVVTHTMLAVL